jgi:hypothetical protein
MNPSIALRLLWKEYRVQRGLWLSMAFGCFILQALIAYLMPSGPERFQGIVPVAFMLTGFYAIGSGAITFAIEREEGTQLRPVMLGCPPGLTLTVKTLFGIVTTALLLALTISSGMLLSLGSLTVPEGIFPTDRPMIVPLTLLFVVLPYLGCLLWSTFFSLLTRKVIVALGLAAVAMICSYTVVGITSVVLVRSGQRQLPHQLTVPQFFVAALVPCLLAALLLAMNYLLTHRWLTRAFFDQTSAKSPSFFKRWRIRRSGLDGGLIVEIGVEDRTAFEVISPEAAVHQPPPRFGLSLLYATWGPNLWRHLRFLRWREAIETQKLFVGFLLATLIFVTWCAADNANNYGGWHGPVGFFIHAACLACGAMAFRTEQDERKVQRLADMGLRPATVWLSKHVVWLVRAVISVAAILFCVLFVSWLYSSYSSRMGLAEFVDGVWLNTQLPNSLPDSASGIRLVGRAIILTLTMYSIGQVCSQLIRSTIVSMFVSFILGLTAFGWAGACYWFGVPFTLSVFPLAIGCLLVTWYRTKSWMIDDNRGRAWIWPTAAITAAVAVIYFGTGLFRVYEIPWSKPFFNDEPSAEFDDGLTGKQRAAVLAPITEQERNTVMLYQRAVELPGPEFFKDAIQSRTATERWDELSEDVRSAVEEAIALAVEAANSPECAEFSPATTNVATISTSTASLQMSEVIDLLVFDADRELEAGHPDVAVDRLRSAFAVSRHAASRGADITWWWSHHLTDQVLRKVREWATHSVVDEKLVDVATGIVNVHREKMIPIEVVNYVSAIMTRNTLDADMFTLTDLLGDSSQRLPVLLATKFPGESARSHRLLNGMEHYDLEVIKSYRNQQAAAEAGKGYGLADWYSGSTGHTKSQVEFEFVAHHCVSNTPLLAMIASGSAREQLCLQDIRTECQVRATKVVMRLLLKQRETGKLPATLDDFDESLHDPWSDKPFIWYPEGLPADLTKGNSVQVKAGTPFLLTAGYSLQNPIHILPTGDSPESLDTPNVKYAVGGWDQHSSRPDIAVWALPKNADAASETSEVDKSE